MTRPFLLESSLFSKVIATPAADSTINPNFVPVEKMANIPAKVISRFQQTIPTFKNILSDAKNRDVNESDTVTIITDMLSDVFGFDKYSEITREFVIQGTYCDLAIKIDGAVHYLVEVKAIGITLNENHTRQATNYAAKHGIKWVVLTNGIDWVVYRVLVDGKVTANEVCKFSFLELNPKKEADQEAIFMLCRRGLDKDLIEQYYEHRQSVNKYMISAALTSESVSNAIRKELKKLKDGLKVDIDEIGEIIKAEIIKRDVMENDSTADAMNTLKKINRKLARASAKKRKEPKNNIDEAQENSDEKERKAG